MGLIAFGLLLTAAWGALLLWLVYYALMLLIA